MTKNKYIILLLLTIPTIATSRITSKTFHNIVVLGNILANSVDINTDLNVNRNVKVVGNISAQSLTVNSLLKVKHDIAIENFSSAGVVQNDASGNLFSSPTVTLNAIQKDSVTTLWPSGVGAVNTILSVVAPGQLGYIVAATGAGTGNVIALNDFTTNNLIIRSDGTVKNVKNSGVTLTDTNDMTGVNILSAATVDSTTANITNLSAANIGSANMTGDIAMAGHDISGAGTIGASGLNMAGNITMGANNITGSGDITAATFHGALTGGASLDLPLTGGTMTGDIIMGAHNITGSGDITAATFHGTLTGNVFGGASLDLPLAGGTMSGDIIMAGHNITGAGTIGASGLNMAGDININNHNINSANKIFATGIELQKGSAENPSLIFTSGTGAGIYSPTGGELSLASTGTEQLKVDSTGTKINHNLYLNSATRFKDPYGAVTINVRLDPDTEDYMRINLSNYPNTSVFFLTNSDDSVYLYINFDNGDQVGRIITFVNIDDSSWINLLQNSGTLKHNDIWLAWPDENPITIPTAVSLICYAPNSWTPIWGYIPGTGV